MARSGLMGIWTGTVSTRTIFTRRHNSENQFERNLHDTGVSRREDLPGRTLTDVRVGVPQVYVIERIKGFQAHLEIPILHECKLLHQAEINDVRAGSIQDADTGIAKKIRSWGGECIRVKPQVGVRTRDRGIADQIGARAPTIAQGAARRAEAQRISGRKQIDTGQFPSADGGIGQPIHARANTLPAPNRNFPNDVTGENMSVIVARPPTVVSRRSKWRRNRVDGDRKST